MTYIEEMWQTLFETNINPVEERIMTGVAKRVDRDASVFVLAAVLVRMIYELCYEDSLGPFQILRDLAKAGEDHRRATVLISQTYERLQPRLSELEGTLVRLEDALGEARELASAKTGYHPMLGHIPTGETDGTAQLSVWSMILVCVGASLSAFLGLTVCLMVFFG